MNSNDRNFRIFAICVLALLVAVALLNLYQAKFSDPQAGPLSYSRFLDEVDKGHVRAVVMAGPEISGVLGNNESFRTHAADDPDLIKALRKQHVSITALAPPDAGLSWTAMLGTLLPTLLLIAVAFFFLRRMNGSGQGMGLGKSKARRPATTAVTFADVAGVDEARESLQEIVDFLRDPAKFQRLGGRIPSGVLLVGPPGTGKTLLARAIAGEARAPFFHISGSDFVEMFVGVGASRVRDMFAQARKHAPCIVFMDEIDAVGRKRGAGLGSGNDEREQTLNQLLVEMDGFDTDSGVILIAATNRPDVLDPALLRPGRFDREIVVDKPDVLGRRQILSVHVRHVPLAPDVDLERLARITPGFNGAELKNLVNEAALLAARRSKDAIGMHEFDDARDTVIMGPERRTHVMTENERQLIACREGAKVVVALHMPAADPIHKVTIMTRGRATGMVKQLPENDKSSLTYEQMLSRLAIWMSGRAAEEMIFGRNKITSGSAGDIEQASKLARLMVTRWGLSEALGAVAYDENREEIFLGHSVARQHTISEETAHQIAVEIRALLDAALAQARQILEKHRGELEKIMKALLDRETLGLDEIHTVLAAAAKQEIG